jgi:signal transduction histidine kinase
VRVCARGINERGRRLSQAEESTLPDGLGQQPEGIAGDIQAIRDIEAVPTLLDVLCEITGMRFAAVARVTDDSWTLLASKDNINFGLPIGGQLPIRTTLCYESKQCRAPIAFSHASVDPQFKDHHTPRIYNIESYISVPIVLGDGRYFGNLCAIDPAPADVTSDKILGMFTKFAALIASALDRQAAHELDTAALSAERSHSELREQFIAILGHDLRNPLQAVVAAGDLIHRRAADASLQDLANRIKGNAKRMSALIDDILDFARGKLGGGIGLQADEVTDVEAGLEQVVRELQDGHPNRQIVSQIHITRTVRCDLGRVQQLASNLIGNALAHGAPASPVKVTAHSDERDFVLEVWNDGDPIPLDSIPKIFEPFWRNSTSTSRQGLGLGLYICSQIVRAHKGTLSVVSAADGGTTFTARWPLR